MRSHVLHKCKAAPTKSAVARLQKQQATLQQQNIALQQQVEELKTAVATPTTNYVSINLVLNNFSEEDLDHLTDAKIRAILESCVDNPNFRGPQAAHAIVAALGEAIYANPEREENYTACVLSRKAERGYIFHNDKWKWGPAKMLQESMAAHIVNFYQKRQFATWPRFNRITNYFTQNREDILTNNQLREVLLRTGKLLQKRDPRMMEDLIKKFKESVKAETAKKAAETAEAAT